MLLDTQLAALFDVSAKRLNEQVRRNIDRFPNDFILRLTNQDIVVLRSQIATLESLAKRLEALERSVAALDADTRKQFDQVYEAILGLMGSAPRKN